MTSISSDPSGLLRRCYAAAVAAVQPESAMRGPLAEAAPSAAPAWIIAIGKAAPGMARALVSWFAEHDRAPAGGMVVAAEAFDPPHALLGSAVGDHPIPHAGSARAAAALAGLIATIPRDAEVHVAISGGASALIAGPLPTLELADVTQTFELLISSGLDIGEMNAVRKRITRWSAGRLALALAPRRMHVWVISDVAGDDLASIASGPCAGDPWRSDDVRNLLARHGQLASLPDAVRRTLATETPKPGDAGFRSVATRIVANNHAALAAAAAAADAAGVVAEISADPLTGDAAVMGRTIANRLRGDGPAIRIWGGETTVTMSGDSGLGGRSQELALAASELLRGASACLLAAGTDGRDGPTDAAGALVDGNTWARVTAAGRDPADDLRRHDSYRALEAAGALVRTGPSGTNVMDIVIAATGWR